jgi:hypothetical protein
MKILNRFRWLGSDIVLGILIALLSILTAGASYQGSMADSDQTKNNFEGLQMLTNANAEYLRVNQDVIQDYTYFDTYYLNQDNPDIASYYESSFSEALTANMQRPGDEVFDDQYYEEVYAEPSAMFEDADRLFGLAEAWNVRGDKLQLVVLIGAIGLAFAAWASLVSEDSPLRIAFSAMAILTFIFALSIYFTVPVIVV